MSPSVDQNTEFSIAIFPDTQFYTSNENGIFEQMAQWVVERASEYNIRVMLHEGDVVQSGDDSAREWEIASSAIGHLDSGGIPNLLALGNHDANDIRNPMTFRDTFSASRYDEMRETYEAVTEAATYEGYPENAYIHMDILGDEYLFLTLEFGPRDDVVRWANDVLSSHEDASAFLTTHSFTYCDGSLVDADTDHAPSTYDIDTTTNNGTDLFRKLVRPNENLVNVHSGHHVDGPYAATRYCRNDSGRVVTQMYQNYQDISNGGDGWFRLLTINTDTQTARLNTVSPYLEEWSSKPGESFEFELVGDTIPKPGPGKPKETNPGVEWNNAVMVQSADTWKARRRDDPV